MSDFFEYEDALDYVKSKFENDDNKENFYYRLEQMRKNNLHEEFTIDLAQNIFNCGSFTAALRLTEEDFGARK